MKQCRIFCQRHPFAVSVLAALMSGFVHVAWFMLSIGEWGSALDFLTFFAIAYLPVSCFIDYPFVLTLVQLGMLLPKWRSCAAARQWDGLTLVLGVSFNLVYWYVFKRISWPYHILSWAALPLLVIGVLGYIALTYHPQRWNGWKKPLCIAGMVIGVAGEFWWCLICARPFDLLLLLLPVNTALVALRTAINALKTQ